MNQSHNLAKIAVARMTYKLVCFAWYPGTYWESIALYSGVQGLLAWSVRGGRRTPSLRPNGTLE